MDKLQLSELCKNSKHADCKECMCNCHVPGTMENLARKISLLDKTNPGIGEPYLKYTLNFLNLYNP